MWDLPDELAPAHFDRRAWRVGAGDVARSQVALDAQRVILANLATLLERAANAPDYPFTNMKLRVDDDRDFFDSGDPVRGKDAVFGWAQGRALESLAGHDRWIAEHTLLSVEQKQAWRQAIRALLLRMVPALESARCANGGRLAFMMDTTGRPLRIMANGDVQPAASHRQSASTTATDVFYAKGLMAAATLLEDSGLREQAAMLFDQAAVDIEANRYRTDRLLLDGSGEEPLEAGCVPHVGRMLAIGGASVMLQCTGEARYAQLGRSWIRHILRHHVQSPDATGPAEAWDMWECNDAEGQPWTRAGVLLSDPGHATEFTGLALKHLHLCAAHGCSEADDQGLRRMLGQVLRKNFDNGYSARGIGIIKGIDLLSRQAIDATMPWWSLPETMRAAAAMWLDPPGADEAVFSRMFNRCAASLFGYYVVPGRRLLPVQCLEPDGGVADVVPAVPDVDPCYHTGLSLIDALKMAEEGERARVG